MAINLDAVKKYTQAAADRAKSTPTSAGNKTTAKSTRPKKEWEGIDLGAIIRATGAPELEELGAVPDFTVDNSWQGSMDLGNADVNAGYNEFERQRGQLDTLQRYQEAAARNAQKAADYFDYAQNEASAQSFQRALELYQQATDKYNSAVGTYNTGVESFNKNPAVAKQQRQIATVQRAQGKSYAELEQMITETADQMDQVTDEYARAQLQEQMDIYKAVQSQTEMTAADAAKRQGELERELATTKDDTRVDWIMGPNGTPIITRTEYGETAEKARELSRMQNEEYNRTYEEAIAEMPAETREKILAAGAAAENFNRDFGAFQRGQGGTAQEIAEKSAAAQKTMDEARTILRSEGYSAEEIDGFIDWGTQEQNRVSAEKYAAEAEARAMERGTLGNLGASVATGIASGAGYIDLLMQEVREAGKVDPLTGKKKALDFNTDAMMPAVVKNAVIAGESDRIVEKMGLLHGTDENGNLTEEAQKKADLRINAFQLADSMGESAVNMGLSLLGVPGTTLILASGAATQTAIQMKEAGYSDGQALAMAGAAGFAEWATEKYSLENFETIFGKPSVAGMSRKQAVMTTLANIGKQAITEGSEEMASDILNLAADSIILGYDSQWNNKVRDYVAAGMTEQNAYRKVMREELSQWWADFRGGMISGGIFGAAGTGLNIAVNNRMDAQTGKTVREAGNAGQITDMVKAMDKAVQEKAGLAKYDESSNRMVGRAARTMVRQKMDSAISNRLVELGESNPSDVLIAAIRDSADPDVQLNRQEKRALAESRFGQQVAEEMGRAYELGDFSLRSILDAVQSGKLNADDLWVIDGMRQSAETRAQLTGEDARRADAAIELLKENGREQAEANGITYEVVQDDNLKFVARAMDGDTLLWEENGLQSRGDAVRALKAAQEAGSIRAQDTSAEGIEHNQNTAAESGNTAETVQNTAEAENIAPMESEAAAAPDFGEVSQETEDALRSGLEDSYSASADGYGITVQQNRDGEWLYDIRGNGENFFGEPCATREEAIESAINHLKGENENGRGDRADQVQGNADRGAAEQTGRGESGNRERAAERRAAAENGRELKTKSVTFEHEYDGSADDECRRVTDFLKSVGARNVYFYTGEARRGGIAEDICGTVDTNGDVYLRADDDEFTLWQLSEHERLHFLCKKNPAFRESLMNIIRNSYEAGELDGILAQYRSVYSAAYGVYSGGQLVNAEEVDNKILEEIGADALSGMNSRFRAGSEKASAGVARATAAETRNAQQAVKDEAAAAEQAAAEAKTRAAEEKEAMTRAKSTRKLADQLNELINSTSKDADKQAVKAALKEVFEEMGWNGINGGMVDADGNHINIRDKETERYIRLGKEAEAKQNAEAARRAEAKANKKAAENARAAEAERAKSMAQTIKEAYEEVANDYGQPHPDWTRDDYLEAAYHAQQLSEQAKEAEAAGAVQQERIEKGQVSADFGQPENHIEQRTSFGKKNQKAFGWDYPQLYVFLREAAGEISSDLDNTLRAEKNFAWVEGEGNTSVQGLMVTGNKRYTSEAVAYLKDSFGMSYAQIEKAVQDYLEGGEAINSTDCKKLEFVLDDLLSRDHDAFGSTGTVYANEAYIAAKQTIPGAEVRETFEYDGDDGMDELPFAIGGRKTLSAEEVENSNNGVWRLLEYDDTNSKRQIQAETHNRMEEEGKTVPLSDKADQYYPDLRRMKKEERNKILKQRITELKSELKNDLQEIGEESVVLQVGDKLLEARLYSTGIKEVLKHITQEKANMLFSTRDIFSNAEYMYSTPDYDGDPNVYRWDYFYIPLQGGEENEGVRIAVREFIKNNPKMIESQIYHWGIKETGSVDGERTSISAAAPGVSLESVSNKTVAQPEAEVKEENDGPFALGGRDYNASVAVDQLENSVTLTDGTRVQPPEGMSAEDFAKSLDELAEKRNAANGQGDHAQRPGESYEEWQQRIRTMDQRQREARARSRSAEDFNGTESLKKLGIEVEGSEADFSRVEQIRQHEEALRKMQKATKAMEKRFGAPMGMRMIARQIAGGTDSETFNWQKLGYDRQATEMLAEQYRALDELEDGRLAAVKRTLRGKLYDQAKILLADNEKINPDFLPGALKRFTKLAMNQMTADRVNKAIFGDERGARINKATVDVRYRNEGKRIAWVNKQYAAVRELRDSKGTLRELTKRESQYAHMVNNGRAFETQAAALQGYDKQSYDAYMANFHERLGLMQKVGAVEAERAAEELLAGTISREEARGRGVNMELVDDFMRNDATRSNLVELTPEVKRIVEGSQWYEQVMAELGEESGADGTIIDNAVDAYREQYDAMYTAINEFLVAHGHREIGFIPGYAPNVQSTETQNALRNALKGLGLTVDEASKLPAGIAGRTAEFKPDYKWNPYFQHRYAETKEYDLVKGYESYVNYISSVFFHTDDVMRLREMVNYIRTTYGSEEIANRLERVNEIRSGSIQDKRDFARALDLGYADGMTGAQVDELIDRYVEEQYADNENLSKFSEYVTWLENEANLLAGKQTMADRGVEYAEGRDALNWGSKLMRTFSSAAVGGSWSSVLNQAAQLPMISTHLGTQNTIRAIRDIITGAVKEGGWESRSTYLTTKKGIDNLSQQDRMEKFVSGLFKPAEFTDRILSEIAVRGEYLAQLDKGVPEQIAMERADNYAKSVMGSRALGQKPQGFASKKLESQMLHVFQLEAMNTFEHVVRDMPEQYRSTLDTEGAKDAAKWLGAAILGYLLRAFALNRITDEIYGGTPAPFDAVGMMFQTAAAGRGMRTNAYLAWTADNAMERLGMERIFDTKREDADEDFDRNEAWKAFSYEELGDLPFVQNAMGVFGVGDQSKPFVSVNDIWKGFQNVISGFRGEDGELGGGDMDWAQVQSGAVDMAAQLLPGGRQLRKSWQGYQTIKQGGDFSGFGESAKLKYAVDGGVGKTVQALLFGKNALAENEEYYNKGGKALTENQTFVWRYLTESSMENEAAFDAVLKYRAAANDKGLTSTEKGIKRRNVIAALPVSDEDKLEVYLDLEADGEEDNKRYQGIVKLMDSGATFKDAMEAANEYARLDGEDGKAGQKATDFAEWADEYARKRGLSEESADIMKETWAFYSQVRAEATTYEGMVDAGISPDMANYIYSTWSGLQPEAGKKTVSDVQKLYVLSTNQSMTDEQRYAVAGTMTDGEEYNEDGELTAYGKMLQAQRQGMPFADYTELRNEGAVDYYFKYRDAVQDNDVARDIAIGMRQLNRDTPEDETVQDWQRVNVICAATDDEDYQVAAMEELLEESEHFRFLQSNAHGITPKIWAEAMEKRPKFDTNYNGSYTQAEYTALVKSMPGLDTEQQAALWQMLAHGKRNPFDSKIGREIYDDYGVWSDAKKKREAAERKAKAEG